MICSVRSLGLTGVSGYQVTAECFISNGLPAFEIVGLPDAAVKESRAGPGGGEEQRISVPSEPDYRNSELPQCNCVVSFLCTIALST